MKILLNVTMAIDSDDLPEWAKFLAVDYNGDVYAYDQQPTPVEIRQGGSGAWLVNPQVKGVTKYQSVILAVLSPKSYAGFPTITIPNWQETGMGLRVGPDSDAPFAPWKIDPSCIKHISEDCDCSNCKPH